MKKRKVAVALLLACIMSLAVVAQAAARWNSTAVCTPGISISGGSAACSLTVHAQNSSDKITADIRLYAPDGSLLAVWAKEATGRMNFGDTYPVSASGTYRMTISVDVSGKNGSDHIENEVTSTKN